MENGCSFVGLLFPRVSELLCPPWPQESELLRLKAFLLFSKLAKVVRVSKKHFFKGEVKRAWVPLMLHCQDPCPDAAQVRHPRLCVPRFGARCPQEESLFWVCRLSNCRAPFSPYIS